MYYLPNAYSCSETTAVRLSSRGQSVRTPGAGVRGVARCLAVERLAGTGRGSCRATQGVGSVSTSKRSPPASQDPQADLVCLFHDPNDPSEVTLIPVGSSPERYLTEWVTADMAAAVSLDEMR